MLQFYDKFYQPKSKHFGTMYSIHCIHSLCILFCWKRHNFPKIEFEHWRNAFLTIINCAAGDFLENRKFENMKIIIRSNFNYKNDTRFVWNTGGFPLSKKGSRFWYGSPFLDQKCWVPPFKLFWKNFGSPFRKGGLHTMRPLYKQWRFGD